MGTEKLPSENVLLKVIRNTPATYKVLKGLRNHVHEKVVPCSRLYEGCPEKLARHQRSLVFIGGGWILSGQRHVRGYQYRLHWALGPAAAFLGFCFFFNGQKHQPCMQSEGDRRARNGDVCFRSLLHFPHRHPWATAVAWDLNHFNNKLPDSKGTN